MPAGNSDGDLLRWIRGRGDESYMDDQEGKEMEAENKMGRS